MRLLIVDDDPDVRRVLSRFLQEREFDVRIAASGQEALARIAEEPPEVIVSDIRMAGIDGLELLQMVRTRFPGIPFILMTGHGDASAIHAVQHGAFDYLKKPIKLAKLLECIRRAQGHRELEEKLLAESRYLLWPKRTGGQTGLPGAIGEEVRALIRSAIQDLGQLEEAWGALSGRLGEEERQGVFEQVDGEMQQLLAAVRRKLGRLEELAGRTASGNVNSESVGRISERAKA